MTGWVTDTQRETHTRTHTHAGQGVHAEAQLKHVMKMSAGENYISALFLLILHPHSGWPAPPLER